MKILRSLPSKWYIKVTAIQEAKDLTKLPMEKLIGLLMTYEINLAKKLQEGEDKKKKSIDLKAITKEEEDVEEEKPSEKNDCETKVWLISILMITKQGLELIIIFQM